MKNLNILEKFTDINSPAPAPAPCTAPIQKCDYSGFIEKSKYNNLIEDKNILENRLKSSELALTTKSDTINTLNLTIENLKKQIARKDTTNVINLSTQIRENNDCASQGFISLVDHNKLLKLEKNKLYILKSESDKISANLTKSEDNNKIYKKTLDKIINESKFYKSSGFWITIIILISIFSGIIYFLLNSNSKSNNSLNF